MGEEYSLRKGEIFKNREYYAKAKFTNSQQRGTPFDIVYRIIKQVDPNFEKSLALQEELFFGKRKEKSV